MRDPQPHGKVFILAFICRDCTNALSHLDSQDLTDQVIVKLQPGKDYRWVIGTGGSATVYRGEWWQSEAGPPVIILIFSHYPSIH